jgi:pimeloyl-ACP methyl ester carboxylesterase
VQVAAPRFAFLALCLASLLLAACGAGKRGAEEAGVYTAPSGVALGYRALLPPEGVSTGRQVLLLHRRAADAGVWEGFAQQLATLGYTVLAPTLPPDVAPGAALEALRGFWREQEGRAPGAACAVIGEAEGAVLALELAATEARVGAAVLLSPVMKLGEWDALNRMRGFEQCPVLLVAAENDTGGATTAMQLKDAAPAFCELALYPGTAKGADLFAIRPAAMTQVSDWLALILGQSRAPG